MKGLILVAGKGTRLQPLTYSQPKTLLPVANKPVLAYCIQSLVEVGIGEIGIVLNPTQEKAIREAVGTGEDFGVQLTYLYQVEAKGIADALKPAEPFIGDHPFILLLGDNLIQESLLALKRSLEEGNADGAIMLAKVANPSDYGIAQLEEGRVIEIEEKPKEPKSNWAVIGAYAFTPAIFKAVKAILPSARGEYEITDAIQWLINQGYTIASVITRKHYSDVGNITRLLEANRWMLAELAKTGSLPQGKAVINNCTLIPPVIIGDGCELTDSTIGPYVSIANDAKVAHCHIENSILLKGATLISIPQKIKDSVFGQYSRVSGNMLGKEGDGTFESINYVLGDKSTVQPKRRAQEQTGQRKDNR